MDNRVEKIRELLASEEFGNEVMDIDTVEGFQEAFRNHGVEMTLEEVESVLMQAAVASGELNEEDLEAVSGGFIGTVLIIGGCIVLAYGVGWAAGRILRNRSGVCMSP